jgi:sugar lactone lactonase YvrE
LAVEPGDILVADDGANAVISIDPASGSMEVVSSGGSLSEPSGISVNPTDGSIYVTDRSGGPAGEGALIRIDPLTGVQEVLSFGGNLAMPEDVVVRSFGLVGQIMVLDGISGLVQIDPETGGQTVVSSRTGGGLMRFSNTAGLRVGRPIIVDSVSPSLYDIDTSTGNATRVGQAGDLRLPTGVAGPTTTASSPTNVFVSDAGTLNTADGKIIEVQTAFFDAMSPETNQIVISEGGMLADPFDLASDSQGTLYVVDPAAEGGNGAVIIVTPFGDQTLLATGSPMVKPVAIELFPLIRSSKILPDLYVANTSAAEILRIDRATGAQKTISSQGLLVAPVGVVMLPRTDTLFVADAASGTGGSIIRIDAVSGVQDLVSTGGSLLSPERIALASNGDLLVVDSQMGGLLRIDPDTGSQTTVATGIAGANGITIRGDGGVYVTGSSADSVVRVDLSTGTTQVVGSGGDLGGPQDIAAQSDGQLIVLDGFGGVLRINPDTYDGGNPAGNQTILVQSSELVAAQGIGIDPDGNLLISDAGVGNGAILRTFRNGGTPVEVSSGASLMGPEGIASGRVVPRPGDILVADAVRDAIVGIDPATGDQWIVSRYGLLAFPDGIAIEAGGNSLLVAESQNNALLRIDLTTGQQVVHAEGGNLVDPRGVVVDAQGTIFVSNRESPFEIVRVDPVSGAQAVVASGIISLQKLAVDPQTQTLFASVDVIGFGVSDEFILSVDPGALPFPVTPVEISVDPALIAPNEMVVDPVSGDIFVANRKDVLRIDRDTGGATLVTAGGFLSGALGLAREANGDLIVADVFGDSVLRIDPATGVQRLVSFGNSLGQPQGVVVIPIPEPGGRALAVAALVSLAVLRRSMRQVNSSRGSRSAREGIGQRRDQR